MANRSKRKKPDVAAEAKVFSGVEFAQAALDAEPVDSLEREERRKDAAHGQTLLDQETDRSLRKSVAFWIVWLLAGQLAVVHIGLVSLACCGNITIDATTIQFWITGTVLETFGIVLVIAKYLFAPDRLRAQAPQPLAQASQPEPSRDTTS